jgi:5'-3' exonuclease
LFRAHYSKRPERYSPSGQDVKATVGLITSVLSLLREEEVTHIGIAFDNPVESFRNKLFDGYKTGEGIEEALRAQFDPVEEAARALGLVVWALDDWEADDMLAAGAARWTGDFDQVRILSPDKDMGQCIVGDSVVQVDRIRKREFDEAAFRARRGFAPESMPDFLALVGDTADGIPGLPGFGEKTVGRLLAKWPHLEDIPQDPDQWEGIRGAARLAGTLTDEWEDALLYRKLATLDAEAPLPQHDAEALAWAGVPRGPFEKWCEELGVPDLLQRPHRWQE